MALSFTTVRPTDLLATFRRLIDERQIVTWAYDKDGDFTHTAEQWIRQAWMKPEIGTGILNFYIIPNRQIKLSKAVYGIYHGRLAESFLTHCDTMFATVQASAILTGKDRG